MRSTVVVSIFGTVVLPIAIAAVGARTSMGGIAPPVEFRIIERTGQTQATPDDGVLNFAVQARVNGGGPVRGLGAFSLNIIITGESQTFGALSRDRISNVDGTYFAGIAGPASGVSAGLARQYGYYAGINGAYNGLINSSGATWTQTSSQDIGLITGAPLGSYLIGTPGVDVNEDGDPDTAVFGSGQPSATLPASIMREYFAADTWVDIYRFRYTLSSFSPRDLNLGITGDGVAHSPTYRTFSRAINNLDFGVRSWRAATTWFHRDCRGSPSA